LFRDDILYLVQYFAVSIFHTTNIIKIGLCFFLVGGYSGYNYIRNIQITSTGSWKLLSQASSSATPGMTMVG